jgi:hypothetical protein
MSRTIFAVTFSAILVLGVLSIPLVSAQGLLELLSERETSPNDKYFAIRQEEFRNQFNQVASNNRLKALLVPARAGNLDPEGCDRENQCFYIASYGRGFTINTRADERGGNIRLIFNRL